MEKSLKSIDHPIFLESIQFIRSKLKPSGLDFLQSQVLERLIHTSGDFSIQRLLKFSPHSCQIGLDALLEGASILTDSQMAAAGIRSMASRTIQCKINSVLEWAPKELHDDIATRTSIGLSKAWMQFSNNLSKEKAPIVLIGSSPTALIALLDLVKDGAPPPSLIIGMPVGFIGVLDSKLRLFESGLPFIAIEGTRGGSALASATLNALLRACIN